MRDPGLVHRAECAAIALERAWGQWRSQHGLGAQPPTPVSSYVGYSLEEPWGQPRVVFGVAADEAELLAALLDGHDCVGPVHAELTDWRRSAGSHLPAPPFAADNRLAVPAQASSPAEPARSPAESVPLDTANQEPAADDAPEQLPGERAAAGCDPLVLEAIPVEPVPVVPLEELAPLPPNEASSGAFDPPGQGTGYAGPRYQGSPPQYQAHGTARSDDVAAVSDDDASGAAGSEPGRAVPQMISRLSRSRRSQRGAHEPGTWPQETEGHQAAADTAV